MTLRLALIGAGRIGQVHAKAVASTPSARLVAVADPDDESAQRVIEISGAERTDIDGVVSDPAIDAVLICSPTDLHAQLCESVAHSGKALFCEKPIDLNLERAKVCAERVAAAGVPAMLGFNRRFDPHFNELKRQLETGAIGSAELVQITSRDPSPPPAAYIARSGGLFRDMMIHDLDMASYLLGEPLSVVGVVADALVDPEIGSAGDVDTAIVTLRAESGALVVITNSRRASYGYDQRIEVHGVGGCVSVGNPATTMVTRMTANGLADPPLMDFFMERYANAYRIQIETFIALCMGEPVGVPTLGDGVAALRLADECSLNAGVTV